MPLAGLDVYVLMAGVLLWRPTSLFGQRIISVAATALQLITAIGLYVLAGDGEPRADLLGNWPAPFGIVLVLDRLAATMLLLAGAARLRRGDRSDRRVGQARTAFSRPVPVPDARY